MTLRIVSNSRCVLGEGPIWSVNSGLWWVDIKGKQIYNLNQSERSWETEIRVSAIGEMAQGGLICATEMGIATFDPDSGKLEELLEIEPNQPYNRSNDGKVSRDGKMAWNQDDEERTVWYEWYDGQLTRLLKMS